MQQENDMTKKSGISVDHAMHITDLHVNAIPKGVALVVKRKSGMGTERALRVREEAARGITDLFSQARTCGMTHDAMLTRRNILYAQCRVYEAPLWVHAYLDGCWNTHQAYAYKHDLVFGGMVDGVFYSTHNDRQDYYERNGISPCDFADNGRVTARGHYWQQNLHPFFV
jgi:hypothetical protein